MTSCGKTFAPSRKVQTGACCQDGRGTIQETTSAEQIQSTADVTKPTRAGVWDKSATACCPQARAVARTRETGGKHRRRPGGYDPRTHEGTRRVQVVKEDMRQAVQDFGRRSLNLVRPPSGVQGKNRPGRLERRGLRPTLVPACFRLEQATSNWADLMKQFVGASGDFFQWMWSVTFWCKTW